MDAMNEIIKAELKRQPCIKRAYGIVTEEVFKEIDETQLSTGKFKVRIIRNQDELEKIEEQIKNEEEYDTRNDLVLINKTHDELKIGDHVWVHYWRTISDGYIAIKIGLSSFEIPDEHLPYYRFVDQVDDVYVIIPR